MGGFGSGRRGGKDTTSSFRRLDVRKWQRLGYLEPGKVFGWQWTRNDEKIASINVRSELEGVALLYRSRSGESEDWKSLDYRVSIEWTPCNYGGRRAWFRCPAKGCGRRVAVLFGGAIFACRHCYQLAYESQREPEHYRALNRTQAIRMKLGGSGSLADPFPPRPKGMHRRTYLSYLVEAEQAEERAIPPWLLKRVDYA